MRNTSTASITSWAKKRCKTCWCSVSPIPASSPSGIGTTSTTCKSPRRRARHRHPRGVLRISGRGARYAAESPLTNCHHRHGAPCGYDGISLRNETFKVLQALQPVRVPTDCVLGQYGPGLQDGYPVRGYRDEDDVPPDSITPTFVALKLRLANWRWAGVPIYLRTGKRLLRKLTQVSIHFKPTPHLMFPVEDPCRRQQNVLTFRLQPDKGFIIHSWQSSRTRHLRTTGKDAFPL